MKKTTGIYKITSPMGKIYIGQSRNVFYRWKQYDKDRIRKKNNRIVDNSILKYGYENHVFELIHELPKDIDQAVLNTYEQIYIDQYKSCGIELMNLRDAGYHGLYSEESKMRMRLAQLGKKSSPEAIAKRVVKLRGQKRTEEAKLKISIANTGKKRSAEVCIKLSILRKGIPASPESVQKMSGTLRGRKLSEEHKAKIGASNKLVIRGSHSEETKAKMSVAHKGKKQSPESVIKSALARVGKKRTPEQKERMRIGRLLYQQNKKLLNAIP